MKIDDERLNERIVLIYKFEFLNTKRLGEFPLLIAMPESFVVVANHLKHEICGLFTHCADDFSDKECNTCGDDGVFH